MHRQILIDCLPGLAAIVVALVVLRVLVRLSGARWDVRRLKEVHACQDGGVQSLAFVLTLPLFIVIVQFIVQVSQLMIGVMVVNYSAYAAARSAAVWVPAHVEIDGYDHELENKLPPPITESRPLVLRYVGGESDTYKYDRIFAAAVLACAPVAPSRDLGYDLDGSAREVQDAAKTMYGILDPASARNDRIPDRVENKVAYSYWNTAVRIEFVDKDSRRGPTYNPRRLVRRELPNGEVVYERVWDPHEVGWQDPITVTVTHEFALLPGPGRFLSKFLVRADGRPDRVSGRINQREDERGERLYTTPIVASATMTNEGFKPAITYVQEGCNCD
ncbi:MAG: hypothetical protein ACREIV_02295 [Planctomycetaceae bacterium]